MDSIINQVTIDFGGDAIVSFEFENIEDAVNLVLAVRKSKNKEKVTLDSFPYCEELNNLQLAE